MVILEKLKYVSVVYYNSTKNVKPLIQEHYDIPEYENTVFLLSTYNIFDYTQNDIDLIKKHCHIIYYMLDHKLKDGKYTKDLYIQDSNCFLALANTIPITEWWTMDYEPQSNKIIRDNLSIPIKYKPVRYTTLIKPVDNIYTVNKTIDFCHIGTIGSDYRIDLIKSFEFPYHGISFKFITQSYLSDNNIAEMNTCRFILDTLRDGDMITPNQVRIFELLCMGYTVCTQKCGLNMFPGLVYEWETVDDLVDIVKNKEYLHPTEAYKEMTYTDKAYEEYVNNLIKLQCI